MFFKKDGKQFQPLLHAAIYLKIHAQYILSSMLALLFLFHFVKFFLKSHYCIEIGSILKEIKKNILVFCQLLC